MAKYFITWEVDPNRAPVDPKERGAAWLMMAEMIKKDIQEGKTTDWGAIVGEGRGYSIGTGEQSLVDLSKDLQRYFPYVTFNVHQVMSVDEVIELSKSMMQ